MQVQQDNSHLNNHQQLVQRKHQLCVNIELVAIDNAKFINMHFIQTVINTDPVLTTYSYLNAYSKVHRRIPKNSYIENMSHPWISINLEETLRQYRVGEFLVTLVKRRPNMDRR